MQFEVFIPSLTSDGFDVTLVIESKNWMKALQLALERTTHEDVPVRNVLCDIVTEDMMHVTDYETRRVFRIRTLRERPELSESQPTVAVAGNGADAPATQPDATSVASAPLRSVSEPEPPRSPTPAPQSPKRVATAPAAAIAPPSQSQVATVITKAIRPDGSPLEFATGTGVMRSIGFRAIDSQVALAGAQVLQERTTPTMERQEALDGKALQAAQRVTDTMLEDVFLEINDLFEGERSLNDAVTFALELAMRHIGSESGSALFADEVGEFLYFAVARGPKADELLKRDLKVPIEQGIAGFCVRNGVAIAVTDAAEDPRYFRKVAEVLNYNVRSILCAPIQCEGFAFGALELVNHSQRPGFSGSEATVLSYIGKQAGRFVRNLTQ